MVRTLEIVIKKTKLLLKKNEHECVTYMIQFLEWVLAGITKYEDRVNPFLLYKHVLVLISSYDPPEWKTLYPVHEPALPSVHEDEEEVEDGGDGGRSVLDMEKNIKLVGRGKMMRVIESIVSNEGVELLL